MITASPYIHVSYNNCGIGGYLDKGSDNRGGWSRVESWEAQQIEKQNAFEEDIH